MTKHRILLVLVCLFVAATLPALTVKLGSPFPEGSPWDITLRRMASEWQRISEGQVRLQIYPGGVVGDEGDMIRKMRFGQLDAAILTSFGMKSIVPNTFVMSLPGILQSEEELNRAISDFSPLFDDDFISKGFRVLAWSKSGWAKFFTKQPAHSPQLMRKERLAVNSWDEELAANFKAMDFNVVPTNLNQTMVGLQSGMISAVYAPPIAAAGYQWFSQTPYILDFNIAPVLGAFVVGERSWQRIPEEFHADFKAAIKEMAQEFFLESDKLNNEAMEMMLRHGIIVEELSESEKDEWTQVLIEGHALVVGDGKWIDRGIYEEFISYLENLR